MDIDFIMNSDNETYNKQVIEANRVYSLMENLLQMGEILYAMEEYKNSNNWSSKSKLNVPATIASYFLFYMVTINDKYEKYNKSDYILNVDLIGTFFEQPRLLNLQLSPYDQIRVLVECGLNLNVGFVWEDF